MTHKGLVYYARGRWFIAVRSRTPDGRLRSTHVLGGHGWDRWSDAATAAAEAAEKLASLRRYW